MVGKTTWYKAAIQGAIAFTSPVLPTLYGDFWLNDPDGINDLLALLLLLLLLLLLFRELVINFRIRWWWICRF